MKIKTIMLITLTLFSIYIHSTKDAHQIFFPIVTQTVSPLSPTTRDVLQTIPPVVTSNPNAVADCTTLFLTPGSAISGTNGFLRASCIPNAVSAMFLKVSATPTFILSVGFTQLVLMAQNAPCSFDFTHPPLGVQLLLTGMNLTSSGTITFLPFGQFSTTQLTAGSFDYCLFYQNPPDVGISSFTIKWTA